MARRTELINSKSLLKLVRPMIFDIAVEERRNYEEAIGPVTCKRGCAYCCYQKQLAHFFEGAVIAAYLEENKLWTADLENRLRWADKALTESTHLHWVKQNVPCVFLKEKAHGVGECTVYQVRPLSCAITLSTNTDPRDCQHEDSTVLKDVSPTQVRILELKAAMERGNEEPLMLYTLPGAVLYARAKVMGLPLPDVHHVPMTQLLEEGRRSAERANLVTSAFDKVATLRDEE